MTSERECKYSSREADLEFATALLSFLDGHIKSKAVLRDEHARFKLSIEAFCNDLIARREKTEEEKLKSPAHLQVHPQQCPGDKHMKVTRKFSSQ